MKRKWTKRLLSTFVAVMMLLSLLPTTVFAAEGDVAQIGDTTYATLDEAVAAAADGATIELLGDATTTGLNLNKNLTIQAASGVVNPDYYVYPVWYCPVGNSSDVQRCDRCYEWHWVHSLH